MFHLGGMHRAEGHQSCVLYQSTDPSLTVSPGLRGKCNYFSCSSICHWLTYIIFTGLQETQTTMGHRNLVPWREVPCTSGWKAPFQLLNSLWSELHKKHILLAILEPGLQSSWTESFCLTVGRHTSAPCKTFESILPGTKTPDHSSLSVKVNHMYQAIPWSLAVHSVWIYAALAAGNFLQQPVLRH